MWVLHVYCYQSASSHLIQFCTSVEGEIEGVNLCYTTFYWLTKFCFCLSVRMYVCMSVLYLQAFNWQCYNEIHITCSMLPHLEVQTLASPAQTTSVVPSAGALEGVAWSCDMDGAVDTSGIVCSTDKICDQSHGLPSWTVYPCLPWWEVWSLWEMHFFVLSLQPEIIHVRSSNNLCLITLHDSYLNFTIIFK